MVESFKKALKSINNKEMFDLIADANKTALDCFMDKGFTREEAFQLILGIGVAKPR